MSKHPLSAASWAASRLLIGLAGAGLVAMTAIIGWQVIGRYILGASPSWSEQAAQVLMIWFAFLAAAAGIREGFRCCQTNANQSLEPLSLLGSRGTPMARISYKRHRFPSAVIQYTVWLYFRFTLSFRDVEEMMAHRGVDVSYETIRYWTIKFGPAIAANLRRRKLPPSPRWHLDEMVSTIAGERVWIWRAVDDEGEVMDMIVQKRRDTRALRFDFFDGY
jgi:hypothetical protein